MYFRSRNYRFLEIIETDEKNMIRIVRVLFTQISKKNEVVDLFLNLEQTIQVRMFKKMYDFFRNKI